MPDQLSEPTGSLDRSALRYLARVFETDHPSDEPFVFTRSEKRLVGWATYGTVGVVVFMSILFVFAFFLPHRFWPYLFGKTHLGYWNWPFISLLFGILLLYLKVYLQTAVHAITVKFMSLVCQFPRYHDADYSKHMNVVSAVTLRKGLRTHLLKPPPVIPQTVPWHLAGATLKALLIIGLIELLGRWMPVSWLWLSVIMFAAWDGWTSHRILRDACIRILAPLTIRQFVNELAEEYGREPGFQNWIPSVMHSIGVGTGSDNYPHLLLNQQLAGRFGPLTHPPDGKIPALQSCPPVIQNGLERLLIFTALIDGRLHSSEGLLLCRLHKEGWLKTPLSEIKKQLRSYRSGEGLWV